MKALYTLIISLIFMLTTAISANEWRVEEEASTLGFIVDSRLGEVPGTFHKWNFEGKIASDFKVTGKVIVDVASIDTRNRKRDDHLRNPDFFEVEKYPTAIFSFDQVTVDPERGSYTVNGKLKIRDIEKPITFKFKEVSRSDNKLHLKSLFIVDRTDFGITYNSILNPIDDEIVMRIELVLKKN